jgi:hypothetical protein
MSIEAFIWPYENGEPSSLEFAAVLKAFGDAALDWDAEDGRLPLQFGGPPNACDLFCDKDAAEMGRVRSLMISRPLRHESLWQAVLRIMAGGHCVLFFSDDTTPLFRDLRSVRHFPADLIASLGTPVCVQTPEDIIASHEG